MNDPSPLLSAPSMVDSDALFSICFFPSSSVVAPVNVKKETNVDA